MSAAALSSEVVGADSMMFNREMGSPIVDENMRCSGDSPFLFGVEFCVFRMIVSRSRGTVFVVNVGLNLALRCFIVSSALLAHEAPLAMVRWLIPYSRSLDWMKSPVNALSPSEIRRCGMWNGLKIPDCRAV